MGEDQSLLTIRRILILSIVLTTITAVAEIIISFLYTNSLTVLADGIDGIGNLLISLIVLIGISLFTKYSNEKSFKIESLSAYTAAILSLILAFYLLYNIINKLYTKHVVRNTELAIIIVIISAIVSFGLSIYKFIYSKKLNLLSLKIDAFNSLKDSLGSIIAIPALIMVYNGIVILDLIVGIVISVFIILASIAILKESSTILLDIYQEPVIKKQIFDMIIRDYPYIKDINSIQIQKLGKRLFLQLEIKFEENITVKEMKKIFIDLENKLKRKFPSIYKINMLINYK